MPDDPSAPAGRMHMMRTLFYGVDFSGAKRAGRSIWVARAIEEGGRPRVVSCIRGDKLEGSGRDRDACLAALRRLVAANPDAVFGFDFPFGVPAAFVKEPSWEEFIQNFPKRFDSAGKFRKWCRERSEQGEPKRRTDRETKTPFAPSNLRLYRQTFYGIRDLLSPVVRDETACILPMQEHHQDRAWLLEICPASTLKRDGIEAGLEGFPGKYKGRSSDHRAARERILRHLEERHRLLIAPEPGLGSDSPSDESLRSRILENPGGDALDSVIAALAAWRATRAGLRNGRGFHPDELLEGHVYV
jgi:hypothetical protein